jgi:hypothetical protein
MLGACVVCLLVAGLIEGLVSASAASWTGRLLATGTSLLFLAGYLVNGMRLKAKS